MAACSVDFDNAVKHALNLLKSSELVLKESRKKRYVQFVWKSEIVCVFFQRDLENL